MSVKVISEGPHFNIAECRNCGSILDYTRADTREKSKTDYLGDTEHWLVVTCAKCSADVFVKPKLCN